MHQNATIETTETTEAAAKIRAAIRRAARAVAERTSGATRHEVLRWTMPDAIVAHREAMFSESAALDAAIQSDGRGYYASALGVGAYWRSPAGEEEIRRIERWLDDDARYGTPDAAIVAKARLLVLDEAALALSTERLRWLGVPTAERDAAFADARAEIEQWCRLDARKA